jgi:hypothetical protein
MFTRVLKNAALIICICLLLSLLPTTRAKGVDPLILNVNTTVDGRDFATNSVCSVGAATGGPCTLRAAVSEAKGNVPYQDVIVNIPAGHYLLTIPPDDINDVHSGDLNIIPPFSSSFTITITGIDAQPAIIDANQLDRVFDIGDVHITMRNVVIRGGYLHVTEAFMWGAGIFNYGYLTLDHVVVEDNTLDCGPEYCEFWAYGGGIYNANGSLDIIASTIQNNTSPDASAIYNTSAPVFISYSTIRNNVASRGNTIYHIGANFNIFNSTIAGNTSPGVAGIMNYGNLMIASSTLANSGISASIDHRFGSVTITDSILSAVPNQEGTSYNCFIYPADLPWNSLGHNIFSDDTCPATGTSDLINTDPLLGELDWWGGPTMTLPLLLTSPAIDHHPSFCWDMYGLNPLLDDQRYILRDDGQCDTGAFEGFIYPVKVFLPLINR